EYIIRRFTFYQVFNIFLMIKLQNLNCIMLMMNGDAFTHGDFFLQPQNIMFEKKNNCFTHWIPCVNQNHFCLLHGF
ncbi:hypothetical protein ABXJ11_23450, partial (plasmid) [Escherichia coli]